jgi:two-component system sensor histidine kinase KdpD
MQGRTATWLSVVGALLAVLGATGVGMLVGASPTITGFLFLIVVLFAATFGGLTAGIFASIAAAICYSLFLPPVGSVQITNRADWVAFAAFLTAAVVASRLVTLAGEQARRAGDRAREVEAMNALTVDVLVGQHDLPSLGRLASDTLIATGSRAAGVLLYNEGGGVRFLCWCGDPCPPDVVERALRAKQSVAMMEMGHEKDVDFLVPLVEQGRSIGVLASLGTSATRSAVESVAKILNLALQREQLLREQVHIEALRESEELKTALLRAVSHDLSTPLTSIGFHVDALRRKVVDLDALGNVVELEREAVRLRRRIEGLLSFGRLEAGVVVPRPEPVPPADLFRSARESLSLLARPLAVRIDQDCPEVLADPSLALEIIVNLLENADRASSNGVPIDLVAEESDGHVRLGVLDRGRGIGSLPAGQVIEASDVLPRGLGLEISRRLAEACGGVVTLEARDGGGVAAWVQLPAVPVMESE